MYRKRNKKIWYGAVIALLVAVFVIAAAAIKYTQRTREEEAKLPKYEALLYKPGNATVEFDSAWLKEDTDDTTVLNIEADTLVDLLVTPGKGQTFTGAEVMDHQFARVSSFLGETSSDAVRLTFVMPEKDVIIQLHLEEREEETEEKETEAQTETNLQTEQETEAVTDAETETEPYGLTLHGLTADIITSYNGMFDDQRFLTQLGEALHMDSARSEYRRVTDVTFSQEAYAGEQDTDKVYHYIYFNENPDWKLLSTYYMADDSYLFTEVEEIGETELQRDPPVGAGMGGSTGSVGTSGGSYSSPVSSGNTAGGSRTSVTTTAFDVMSVSTTFLAYIGGEEEFYQKLFDYVVKNGLTGNITGTMSSYEILPEKKKATAEITLSTGGTVTVTFNKEKGKFKFSGLG